MNKIYALVMITGEEGSVEFGIEPVGVYSTMELAFEFLDKLEKQAPNIKGQYFFDIFEYTLDERPLMLDFFKAQKKQQRQAEDDIQNIIVSLMKDGIIDQLIGEDGHFYYSLTKKGKKLGKDLGHDVPKKLRKFFKRDEDEMQ